MRLQTEPYFSHLEFWPSDGHHILAHFDNETIVVYQAYRRSIADQALKSGELGGPDFSYGRMSWIKPNFLWMMYRSGWATKPDQEAVLGFRLRRTFFDRLLAQAVVSSFDPLRFANRETWMESVAKSDVRLQWDPDHHPNGAKLARRALQLGLRGMTLEAFGKREILEVIDLSDFVAVQRQSVTSLSNLMMPVERVYSPENGLAATKIGLSVYKLQLSARRQNGSDTKA